MNMAWTWGILGLVLLGLEMATGTFYVLWFGVAGLLMSGVVALYPQLSSAMQLFLYALVSTVALLAGKFIFKREQAHDLKVGQSHGDEIGRVGIISEAVSAEKLGRIRFIQGLMGSREWRVVSDVWIDEGEQATVVGVEGNVLRVVPTSTAALE